MSQRASSPAGQQLYRHGLTPRNSTVVPAEGRRRSIPVSARAKPRALSPRSGALVSLSSRAAIPPPPANAYVADVHPVFTIDGSVRCVEPVNDRVVWSAEYNGTIGIRALPKGNLLKQLAGREGSFCVALLFAPETRKMWAAFQDGYIHVYDVMTTQLERETMRHAGGVFCMLLLEGTVFTGGNDWKVGQWSPEDASFERGFFGHKGAVRCLAGYSGPTGSILFSGGDDGTIHAWDPYAPLQTEQDTACRHVFLGHSRSVTALEPVAHANQLWSGGEDTTVRVWSLETLDCLTVLNGHAAPVSSLMLLESRMWSGDKYGRIILWDTNTLTCLQEISGRIGGGGLGMVLCMKKVVPCTSWKVWTGGANGTTQCWSAETVPIVFDAANASARGGASGSRAARADAVVYHSGGESTAQMRQYVQDLQEELAAARRDAELAFEHDRQEVQRELETQQLLQEENEALKRRLEELGETVPEPNAYASGNGENNLNYLNDRIRQLEEQLEDADRTISNLQDVQQLQEQAPTQPLRQVTAEFERDEVEKRYGSPTLAAPSGPACAAILPGSHEPITKSHFTRRLPGDHWDYVLREKPHELLQSFKDDTSTALGVPATQMSDICFELGSLIASFDLEYPAGISRAELDRRLQSYTFDRLRELHDGGAELPKTDLDAAEQELFDTNMEMAAMQDTLTKLQTAQIDSTTEHEKEIAQLQRDNAALRQQLHEDIVSAPFATPKDGNSELAPSVTDEGYPTVSPASAAYSLGQEAGELPHDQLRQEIENLKQELERERENGVVLNELVEQKEEQLQQLRDEFQTVVAQANKDAEESQKSRTRSIPVIADNSEEVEALRQEIEQLKLALDVAENELETEKESGDYFRDLVQEKDKKLDKLHEQQQEDQQARAPVAAAAADPNEELEALKEEVAKLKEANDILENELETEKDSGDYLRDLVQEKDKALQELQERQQQQQQQQQQAEPQPKIPSAPTSDDDDKAPSVEISPSPEDLDVYGETHKAPDASQQLALLEGVAKLQQEVEQLRSELEAARQATKAAERKAEETAARASRDLAAQSQRSAAPSTEPSTVGLKHQIETLERKVADADKRAVQLREEKEKRAADLLEREKQVRELQRDKSKLERDLKWLQDDKKRLEEVKSKSEEERRKLADEVRKLEREKKALAAQPQLARPSAAAPAPADPRMSIVTEQDAAAQVAESQLKKKDAAFAKLQEDHNTLQTYVQQRLQPRLNALQRELEQKAVETEKLAEAHKALQEQVKADRHAARELKETSLTTMPAPATPAAVTAVRVSDWNVHDALSEQNEPSVSPSVVRAAAERAKSPPVKKEESPQPQPVAAAPPAPAPAPPVVDTELQENYDALERYVNQRLRPQLTELRRDSAEKELQIDQLEAALHSTQAALDDLQNETVALKDREEEMSAAVADLESSLHKERKDKEVLEKTTAAALRQSSSVSPARQTNSSVSQERVESPPRPAGPSPSEVALTQEKMKLQEQLRKAEQVLQSVQGSLQKNADSISTQSNETAEMINRIKAYNKDKSS